MSPASAITTSIQAIMASTAKLTPMMNDQQLGQIDWDKIEGLLLESTESTNFNPETHYYFTSHEFTIMKYFEFVQTVKSRNCNLDFLQKIYTIALQEIINYHSKVTVAA